MTTTLSASKQPKALLRLLNSLTPTTQFARCRHLCTDPKTNTTPSQPDDDESIIDQAVQILQSPDHDRNSSQLLDILFADPPSSPHRLLRIIRRLPSSSLALKFLDYVRSHSPSPDPRSLASACEAVFELASREPDWLSKFSELHKTLKEWNFPLTFNSVTRLIRCFGRADLVDESLVFFKELDPSIKNTRVRNVLMDVLLKSGRVDDALQVLDEMLQPDGEIHPNDATGNIIFPALVKRRERMGRSLSDEEIVELVLKFGEHGVFPDLILLTQLIARLCKSRKTGRAWDLLRELMKLDASVEPASCNALLTGLAREGEFKRMSELLAKMKEMGIQADVVTFGILMNRLCKSGRVDEALEVFEKMGGGNNSDGVLVEPDVIIYNTLIDGLCKVGRQEEGLNLMEKMRSQNGCVPNTVTYNCLIDGFCRAGEMERANELFEQMGKEGVLPNTITLNTLVGGMCRHGRIGRAVEFFGQMQRKGLKANATTYTVLIKAFCNVNNIDKAMKFFDQMLDGGCLPDAVVYYTLISGLSQAGRMDDAIFVATKLKEAGFSPDIVCYNVLIGGLCRKNKLDNAYEILREMEATGVKPDNVTFNTLISYFSKMGKFKTVHRLLRKMIEDGLVPTVVTYGGIIHAYCLNGNLDDAMQIFRDMSSASKVPPNTVIYNILIDALCKNNEVELALSLMDDMKVKSVRPNTTTYNAMLKGLKEKKLLKKAFEFMDRMVEQACNPDYITMEILTEWLSAVGETEKLKMFVQGYQVSASAT